MDTATFRASLTAAEPPAGVSPPLVALWWDARGDWQRAHDTIADDQTGSDAAWVHAYLHRVEGDRFNARYWYGRARRPAATGSIEDERNAILAELLAASERAA